MDNSHRAVTYDCVRAAHTICCGRTSCGTRCRCGFCRCSCLYSVASGEASSLAIIGANGKWPGGFDGEVAQWHLRHARGDALGNVPAACWTLELIVDMKKLTSVQASCVLHGGCVTGVPRFDALVSTGISPAEVHLLDPQQRHLLEHSHVALHASSLRRVKGPVTVLGTTIDLAQQSDCRG